jgi:hypothetical protein
MAERPLLFFPKRSFAAKQARTGGPEDFHFPSPQRQRDRLQPQFAELEKLSASVQGSPDGLIPEQALVLEIIGGIDEFQKALRGLDIDWIGEIDLDGIEPDEDFYNPDKKDTQLSGRLYLVCPNQTGLDQLLSLWKIFEDSPDHPQFRRGRAKFGQLFKQLKTIRRWGHEDRLRETGLLEDWQLRARGGAEAMRVEVELWPRQAPGKRKRSEKRIADLVRAEHGQILGRCDAAVDFAYHAVLVQLPVHAVQRILESPEVALARCEDVMFFRPIGQISAPVSEGPARRPSRSEIPSTAPAGEPIAALLDGLPLTEHHWLSGRLVVDDPEGWEGEYPAAARLHGTAMASLILHGELDNPGPPLSRPLYVRPVMKPNLEVERENIPEEVLPVDLLRRAVERILGHESAEPPVAPTVRIINLSLGDPWRPFDRYPSPWARMLDFLAARHNILFIVSAGNHGRDLEIDVPRAQLRELLADPQKLQKAAIQAAFRETRHRRLLSPAEAINAVTVGALHADSSAGPSTGIDPLTDASLPSLYSAHGPGFRRSVKPEILAPGGRSLFREAYKTHPKAVLEMIQTSRPPGHRVASPGSSPGDLGATRYERGSSNAAALVTRTACHLYDVLEELRANAETGPPESHLAVLLRALLVHGASWEDRPEIFQRCLGVSRRDKTVSRFLGYGALDPARVLSCTEQRVTVLGWGEIGPDHSWTYELPIPSSLSGLPVQRRLVTTLAWFSPINARHHRYRRASLWLSSEGCSQIGLNRIETDHDLTRLGTVQHEVWMGKKASVHSPDESLTVSVHCAEDGGDLTRPVLYGLAVTLEVEEGTGIGIYDEVQSRLKPRVPVRPEVRP